MSEQKPTNDLESIQPQSIEEGLRQLLGREDLYVFGHGTSSKEKAESILKEGLRLTQPSFWTTVVGLETLQEDPDALSKALKVLSDWPHYHLKYIVALGVERLKPDDIPHRRYLQSIVQDREHQGTIAPQYGQPYTINPKFVAGYFNMNTSQFIPNHGFNPVYDPALLETTPDIDIARERDAVPLLEWMGGTATADSSLPQVVDITPKDPQSFPIW